MVWLSWSDKDLPTPRQRKLNNSTGRMISLSMKFLIPGPRASLHTFGTFWLCLFEARRSHSESMQRIAEQRKDRIGPVSAYETTSTVRKEGVIESFFSILRSGPSCPYNLFCSVFISRSSSKSKIQSQRKEDRSQKRVRY